MASMVVSKVWEKARSRVVTSCMNIIEIDDEY